MILWVDAQFSPAIATWMQTTFGIEAYALRDIGLRDATDLEFFSQAKAVGAVILTKDRDFIELLDRLGHPPKVIWITCGNTSNQRLKEILGSQFLKALALLEGGETLVEITGM